MKCHLRYTGIILLASLPLITMSQPDTAQRVRLSTTSLQQFSGDARLMQNFQHIQPQTVQSKVILPLERSQGGKFKVTKWRGNNFTTLAATSPTRSWVQDGKLAIRPGETFIIEDTAAYEVPAETLSINRKMYFPSQVVKNIGIASGESTPTLAKWQLFMVATDSPLSWLAEQGAYGTEIIVGLESTEKQEAEFDGTIRLHFKKIGTGIRIDPGEVELTSPGLNYTERVTLSCTAFDIDPEIEVFSDIGRKRAVFPLKPRQLEVAISDSVIWGFGLQSTDITVKSRGVDGSLVRDESIDIVLEKRGPGKLSSTELTKPLGSLETGTQLKSARTGKVMIKAESPLFVSSSTSVRYVWPYALLLISLIGGMAGSAVRLYKKKIHGKRIVGHIMVGMAGGFLLVLSAAIGIAQMNFSASLATTYTGAIALALLGGYSGDGVFEWLGRKIGVIGDQ